MDSLRLDKAVVHTVKLPEVSQSGYYSGCLTVAGPRSVVLMQTGSFWMTHEAGLWENCVTMVMTRSVEMALDGGSCSLIGVG